MPEAVIRTEEFLEGFRLTCTTGSETSTHGLLGDREKVAPLASKGE